MAAFNLHSRSAAIVIGKTIYICNCSKQDFLADSSWLKHEAAHVKQYLKYGFLRFLVLYLAESYKNGYVNNCFEIEARQKEADENILSELRFN